MRLLYAASKRVGSHFQLNRFLQAAKPKHQIKIAAYEQNYECDIDWLLDALYGIFDDRPNYNGLAMEIYHDQIQQYAPDLVISDCETITTRLANDLNIPVWQVSPLLLYSGLSNLITLATPQITLKSKYPTLYDKYHSQINELKKSERFLIYSHLCDLGLSGKYEWVRPYAKIGNVSLLYEHNIVAAHIKNHRPLIHRLKQENDTLLFSETKYEDYPITVKSFDNDYAHSIRNAKSVIVLGCEDLLSDCFYNKKYAYMIPDFNDEEIMMSISFNEYLSLGKIIYDMKNKIEEMPPIDIEYGNAKFLDEELV